MAAGLVFLSFTCLAVVNSQDAGSNLLQVQKEMSSLHVSGKGKGTAWKSLASIEKLAKNIAEGKEKITPATKDALDAIATLMADVKTEVVADHDADQKLVDAARDLIAACDDTPLPSDTDVVAAGATHQTCRADEAALASTNTADCDAWTNYQKQVVTPGCVPCDGSLWTPECMDTVNAFVGQHKTTMHTMRDACTAAKSAFDTKADQCDIDQGAYESGFCSHRAAVLGECSGRETCNTDTKASRTTTHDAVAASETAFKAEHVAAVKVECYIEALKATEAQVAAKVTACGALAVDTSALDITYHPVPELGACDTTSTDVHPGESSWIDQEYKVHDWFGQVTLNPTTACD